MLLVLPCWGRVWPLCVRWWALFAKVLQVGEESGAPSPLCFSSWFKVSMDAFTEETGHFDGFCTDFLTDCLNIAPLSCDILLSSSGWASLSPLSSI